MAKYHAVQLRKLGNVEVVSFGIIQTDFRFRQDPELKDVGPGSAEYNLQPLYPNPTAMGSVYAAIVADTARSDNPNPARNSLSFRAPCDRIPGSNLSVYVVSDLSEAQQAEFDKGLTGMLEKIARKKQ